MKTININPSDIYKGQLILVNSEHLLKQDVNPLTLAPFDKTYPEHQLNRNALYLLHHAINNTKMHNHVVPVSAYRSEKTQKMLYAQSTEENGIEFTRQFVALPNASEHQTGLAIDLAKPSDNIDFIRPELPFDGIYKEFREELVKCGFILRYPEDKTEITKIASEPWHFRFVGYPHSQIMTFKNLCLEEYHDLLKDTSAHNPLNFSDKTHNVKIYYLKVHSPLSLQVSDDVVVHISGNNQEGVIVTCWEKR